MSHKSDRGWKVVPELFFLDRYVTAVIYSAHFSRPDEFLHMYAPVWPPPGSKQKTFLASKRVPIESKLPPLHLLGDCIWLLSLQFSLGPVKESKAVPELHINGILHGLSCLGSSGPHCETTLLICLVVKGWEASSWSENRMSGGTWVYFEERETQACLQGAKNEPHEQRSSNKRESAKDAVLC